MLRFFNIFTVCTILLFFVGCTNSNSSSKGYSPSNTDIVNRNSGDIENEARLKEFIQNTANGQEDSIRVVAYTKEGDAIITDVKFNGENLIVTQDNTRDKYGKGEITTFECKNVMAEGEKYLILGCKGFETPFNLAERF